MSENSLNLTSLTESYALCLSTEGKSPKTIEWYTSNLKRFAKYLRDHHVSESVTEIGTSEARRFISHLQTEVRRWEDHYCINDDKKLSAFSVQGYARTIKAFWAWLLDEGFISRNAMASLKLPKTPKKVTATFSTEQVKRLLDAGRTTSRGFRNYTILLLLLDTGIRLSELVGLQTNDLDFSQSCLLVRGKGDKERIVPFGSNVRRALRRYIMYHKPEPDFPGITHVFLNDAGLPLKPHAVQSMLIRLGKKAGISEIRCNPHRFRHTFARQYLIHGGDIFTLQRILGHSSLEVVKTYINLLTEDILKQHRKFSPVDNINFLNINLKHKKSRLKE